jgi:copper(I)-binding protein
VNRALRAATVGVLLLSPLALSACSAGQVTQTATQERDKVGGMAQVGDITVRAAELESPRQGTYAAGDDAELLVAFANSAQEADTLVSVEGEGFGGVEIQGAAAAAGTTAGTTTGVGQTQRRPDEIEVPADDIVFVDGDEVSITLTDLDENLTPGQVLELTFVFENAGEVTVPVSVANPEDEGDRGEAFDFHEEEGNSEEGTEDTARERESAEDN